MTIRSIAALGSILGAVIVLYGAQPVGDWRSQGTVYLSRSVNARLHSVPVQAVHVGDGFWTARRKVTTERSLPTMLALLEDHGVVDNFRRLSGRKNVP